MNIKFSGFIATSLDGYIARLDGRVDWLANSRVGKNKQKNNPNAQRNIQNSKINDNEDYGFRQFYDSTSCIVMGRNTFEKTVSFSEWPHPNKRVIVLSKRLKEIPDAFQEKAELYSSTSDMLSVDLQNQGMRHVYIDGGLTIQSFISAKILNEITITRVPILLGNGIPLFGMVKHDYYLELLTDRRFDSGFVQSKYKFLY